MLESLHVKNMALIREEEITFGPGLNILTGETGAGKSIIIGSVNIALGTGNFKDYVPEDVDYSLVELVFVTDNENALEKLRDMDIPEEDGQIIISRKCQKGRSISRVNGETVPLKFVRELAGELIDIHGQHQHQSLLYPKNHRNLLDRFAADELGDRLDRCGDAWHEYAAIGAQLREAQINSADRAKQIDILRYEIDEIEKAELTVGEDEELERSFERMAHGQKIMEALAEVEQYAASDDGAGDQVGRALRALGAVTSYDEQLAQLYDQLSQVEELMSDFGRTLKDYMDEFAYDEEEFYRISHRLDEINRLKSKYGKRIEEIKAYLQFAQEKYDRLTDYDNYLETLQKLHDAAYARLEAVAAEITVVRKKAAVVLEKEITEALVDLNFLDVRFEIGITRKKVPDCSGIDDVCFMISTNPGMPIRPLQDVASGGELSRIMLAIKAVMADQDAIGSLIFDEIDTGISGRTAQKVSEKMAVIARNHQVICITHLAQIAAMADSHFEIAKHTENGGTVTNIRPLDEAEQTEELARILGGVSITKAVRDNAAEMKRLADAFKQQ